MVVLLDKRGYLRIPRTMIDALGLEPGMPVDVESVEGSLVLRPPSRDEEQPIEVRGGVPVFMGEAAVEDLEAWLEAERDARVATAAWEKG